MDKARSLFIDILWDIVGGLFIAIGVYNFAAASNFPLAGFNGIGLIGYHLFKIPIGITSLVLNIPVGIMCYKILGKEFFAKSMLAMVVFTVMVDSVAPLFPIYHGDKLLSVICTGVFSGIGAAIYYMHGYSAGGTDFITMSIKAKKPYISIGKLTFLISSLIIGAGTIFVSKNIDGFIYGMLINFITSIVIDKMMYGISSGKMAMIVTDRPKDVAAMIDREIGRGSTLLRGKGSYSGEVKEVVMCACSKKQMYGIRDSINDVDPYAFMIILESTEVFGKGFGKRKSEGKQMPKKKFVQMKKDKNEEKGKQKPE